MAERGKWSEIFGKNPEEKEKPAGKSREKKGRAPAKVGKNSRSPKRTLSEAQLEQRRNAAKAGGTTGGRKPGTPNRRTVDVIEQLQERDYDPDMPFFYWAEVLKEGMKPQNATVKKFLIGHDLFGKAQWGRPDLRLMNRMAENLAQYVAPKRKAIEIVAEVKVEGVPLQDSALSAPWLNSELGQRWADSAKGRQYLAERGLIPIKRKKQEGGR